MKKYAALYGQESLEAKQEKYNEFRSFQSLLRNSDELSNRFHGKALEIADGIQPWINALEL
ncbi:MAG: hypothetical protein NXI10_07915 [bacterium]|nr:hypothetical protein [bacterium]